MTAGTARRVLVGAAAAVLTVGAVGTWLVLAGDPGDGQTADSVGPQATVRVERDSIAATETWDGTLGRGRPLTVRAGAAGTVTRLVAPGGAAERGAVLARIDERPVVLLYGTLPMYRDLGPGAAGADVDQLETNLAALGIGDLAPDAVYDEATAAAVRSWQERLGATPTGTVARGDVVFVPDASLIGALRSEVGAVIQPGTPLLDLTGTGQIVTFPAELADLDRLPVDAPVTVQLPGDQQVTGTIATAEIAAGAPATPATPAMGDDTEGAGAEPTLQVEVALDENAADELVGAPVEIAVPVDERSDVLLVPVNALLARADGGYALEVVDDDGTTRLVAVDTGLFAEGKVEVDGSGIDEGTVVGVAER